MTSQDANEYILIACKTNNVPLLLQSLPREGAAELPNIKVDAAILATKADNLETFKILGKYLTDYEWAEYSIRKESSLSELPLGNRCVAWANQESQYRAEVAKDFAEKSLIGKVVKIFKDDHRTVAIYAHPDNLDYENPKHSDLLCKEHIKFINAKLKSAHAFISDSNDGEGPTFYKIRQSLPPIQTENKILKAVSAITTGSNEIMCTAEVTKTLSFLHRHFSKEFAASNLPDMNKEKTENNIASIRNQFLNKQQKTNTLSN